MKTAVTALLVGASLLASAQANAAEYLLYTVYGTGTVNVDRGFPSGDRTNFSTTRDTVFQFLLPASAAGSLSTSSGFYDRQTNQVSVTASSTQLLFTSGQSSEQFAANVQFGARVSICGDFSNGLPAQSFVADSTCSSGSSSFSAGSAGLTTSINYSGNVARVSVDRITGENLRVGLIAVPDVPEPATWAMMLVGFGMIAATARYRRRSTKIAYA
ncbi:hypothetical protein GGQ80_002104 [Sphingomonas jinjuensis]|uniref:Ice-binding protein C-terminal domain-containing protein n=1 Tax=Sphingomonas jinjuensis TaxID=535907 RepID=A0A840FEN4_9SPHN|nr:PEPxxWA-CTERM sorting domain-containing protein [Sphingomonas jinjuensis]MBB4154194.1 hypothetical protein [Sphingomonas jinjuensis]